LIGTQVAERLLLEAGPSILEAIKQNRPAIIRPDAEMVQPRTILGDVVQDANEDS